MRLLQRPIWNFSKNFRPHHSHWKSLLEHELISPTDKNKNIPFEQRSFEVFLQRVYAVENAYGTQPDGLKPFFWNEQNSISPIALPASPRVFGTNILLWQYPKLHIPNSLMRKLEHIRLLLSPNSRGKPKR